MNETTANNQPSSYIGNFEWGYNYYIEEKIIYIHPDDPEAFIQGWRAAHRNSKGTDEDE